MGKALGFISLLIVMAVVVYLYMKNSVAVAPGAETGAASPRAIIDTTGVKNHLVAFAQGEKRYQATNSKYAPLDELASNGEISISKTRQNYSYEASYSDTDFKITATYHGPEAANAPKVISIDSSMNITTE